MSLQAKTITLDNKSLDRDGISGILITLQDWQKLSTSDNSEDRSGQHGRQTSATMARIRTITLEGVIDRVNNPYELQAVQYIEQLLCLQSDPSSLVPRTLAVKDIYDREYTILTKVKEPVELVEWDSSMKWSHWSWRCVLESVNDPAYTEKNEQSIASSESAYGGFTIDFAIPFSMDMISNTITVVPTGNGIIRPRIEITVVGTLNSLLTVTNATTGEVFSLDVSGVAGDIIIIDSITRKCSKNGLDITALRTPWSVFPKVLGSTTTVFRVEDADGGVFESDFGVVFYFRNTLS